MKEDEITLNWVKFTEMNVLTKDSELMCNLVHLKVATIVYSVG